MLVRADLGAALVLGDAVTAQEPGDESDEELLYVEPVTTGAAPNAAQRRS